MSLVTNLGRNIGKNISTNLSSKHNQKLLDHAKKSITDVLKTASKREIKTTAEATGDLTGNKIADNIIRVSTTKNISQSY